MANLERESLWEERVAQWRKSGQSQRAFADSQGYPQRQLNYWARRLAVPAVPPALLPVSIAAAINAAPALSLRSPSSRFSRPAALARHRSCKRSRSPSTACA
ncbi:IS66 family insertion sequence element accessory protein TnpA [Massilia mucilaginosa]|uniref:IS66 family insertion sequence element accessory protein TnpA n=1 Tax=Massilia mucilaginosa TaxID=2609282 RepID=UPI003F8ABF6F